MGKNNMIVARIQQHTSAGIGRSERHNERKNETYENINVDPERIHMNLHFKDPCGKSYFEIFKEKEEAGEISTRGLRADATLVDEMIIDVNTMYFEDHGGYEYARQFFEEAFHFAEKKFGEANVISAVMHADEINLAATEKCGHPVYHYHLHVIAIPTVEKQILWSKRCKDESLRGTVKEVIQQVSHSKKWASNTPELDENGNPVLRSNGKPQFLKSYSLLQDEIFEHMREAGFMNFDRGTKGSTAEHLTSLQYQYKKDMERSLKLQKEIQLKTVEYETASEVHKTFHEIDDIGKKRSFTGKILIEEDELTALKGLAKEGITSRSEISRLNTSITNLRRRYYDAKEAYERMYAKYKELKEQCKPYLEAVKHFPDKVKGFMDTLLLQIRTDMELKKLSKNKRNRNFR